jgi:hypothetical protein
MAYVRRPYRGSITVDVDVDINDVLQDMDDESLIEELKARGKSAEDISRKQTDALSGMFDDLREAITSHDLAEAISIIDAFQRPKWPTKSACEAEYAKRKAGLNSPTEPDAAG